MALISQRAISAAEDILRAFKYFGNAWRLHVRLFWLPSQANNDGEPSYSAKAVEAAVCMSDLRNRNSVAATEAAEAATAAAKAEAEACDSESRVNKVLDLIVPAGRTGTV